MSSIVGVIPAAGAGSRLGLPYPKEIHCVEKDVYLIDYSLIQLRNAGIDKAVIVTTPAKVSSLASALKYNRQGVELIYVETSKKDSNSLPGSVARGCKRAYYTFDADQFVVMLPDTKYSYEYCVRDLLKNTQSNASALGIFSVDEPSNFDAVYGTDSKVSYVTVKEELIKEKESCYVGIWGFIKMNYLMCVALRVYLQQAESYAIGDNHLMGEFLCKYVIDGNTLNYVKLQGDYIDLGQWDRIYAYVAELAKKGH